jgi:AraC-like DNA-binding protein
MKYSFNSKPDAPALHAYVPARDAASKGFVADLSTGAPRNPASKRPLCLTGERIAVLPRHIVSKAVGTPALNGVLPTAAGISPSVSSHASQPVANAESLLIYCSRGRGWCEMRGHRYEISSGELFVIPAGTPHVYGADRECLWAISWLQVSGINLPFYFGQLGITPERPLIEIGDHPQMPTFFQEVLEIIEAGWTPAHLTQASQVLTRFFELLSCQRNGHACTEADASQKIRQSIAYMSERLDQPLQVSALAARANISQSHYFALFKRHIGSTPIEYFTQLRIQRACHLLSTTSMSVKGVAATLGYDDPFYFSRVFRQVQGIAPSDYRNTQMPVNAAVSTAA